MTGGERPGGPRPDPEFTPDVSPDDSPDYEVEQVPRRSRQPALTVLALIGVLLLVAAVGIFGGIL